MSFVEDEWRRDAMPDLSYLELEVIDRTARHPRAEAPKPRKLAPSAAQTEEE